MNQSFRNVPKTGVIYVMAKAQAHGFHYGHKDWANLGQGAPETGIIDQAPRRLDSISLDEISAEYSPVAGDYELRQQIADLYNQRYRQGKSSQYSFENVAICAGGRLALTRIAAIIGNINLGHFLPDYTAYEELLSTFNSFVPIPLSYDELSGFKPDVGMIKTSIVNMGLGALLLSNPCNPTGQLLAGNELKQLIQSALKLKCSLIFDEFYSHYIYDATPGQTLSAAAHIHDVNKENVLIIDGLTKNWRYPGLRISWTLGPKHLIDDISAAGSFLDGGATHAIQKAILPLIDRKHADQEALAISQSFQRKRDYMVSRLEKIGFVLNTPPQGSFYCFPSLEKLPKPLNDGMNFFKEMLKHKVICVPGQFFDVNPGQRRKNQSTRLKKYVRLSFGPSMEELKRGLDRIEAVVSFHK
ncbi:MAG: pyridoxal phosphate-dependent aminotransferase [Francisellaceae bacterium]